MSPPISSPPASISGESVARRRRVAPDDDAGRGPLDDEAAGVAAGIRDEVARDERLAAASRRPWR